MDQVERIVAAMRFQLDLVAAEASQHSRQQADGRELAGEQDGKR